MRKILILLSAAVAPLTLAGCVEDGYGGGVAVGYGAPYAYNGYYDGFYGPFYDGYWGGDGFFYYRGSASDRNFRRGDHRHFRHDPGDAGRFHAMQGSFTPTPDMRMRRFGGGDRGGMNNPSGDFRRGDAGVGVRAQPGVRAGAGIRAGRGRGGHRD